MSSIGNAEDGAVEQPTIALLKEIRRKAVKVYHKSDYCTCNLGHAKESFNFKERLEARDEGLGTLNTEAQELGEQIAEIVVMLLEGE